MFILLTFHISFVIFDYWKYGVSINPFSGGHITCKLTFPVSFNSKKFVDVKSITGS